MNHLFSALTLKLFLTGFVLLSFSTCHSNEARAQQSTPSAPRRAALRPSPNQNRQINTSPASAAAFDQINARAAAARDAGQLPEAINLYKQAVGIRPAWAEGWWYVATLSYDLDHYQEARDAFRHFVAIEPKGGAAWALMGLCEFQLRNYEAALAFIQRGRTLGLGDGEQLIFVTRFHAAILLTRFEQYEEAMEILSYFARSLPSENPSVVEAIGLAMLRMPLLPAEVTPDKRDLIKQVGKATYDSFAKHATESRQGFEQIGARYPKTPNVHYANGLMLLLDNPEAAITEFRRELEVSPSHLPARLQLAFAHINQHQFAAGLPYAEQAVQLDPKSFAARNALGRILTETGDLTRAIKELETGLKLEPNSPEMYFALARAYGRAGRKEEAEQARAKFVNLDRVRRTQREGPQAVGGAVDVQPTNARPE